MASDGSGGANFMKSRVFVALLLAGAIGLCESRAGDDPRGRQADDVEKANRTQEEKTERILTGLAHRVQKMIDMQTAVNERTTELHKIIQGTPAKKPRPEDLQAFRQLADKQRGTIEDAARAIALLEADDIAVAFTEVFQELRKDMERLHLRLKAGGVGPDTQSIERDVSETLKDMHSSLTKG